MNMLFPVPSNAARKSLSVGDSRFNRTGAAKDERSSLARRKLAMSSAVAWIVATPSGCLCPPIVDLLVDPDQ
ncbi:hypothetical protein [Luteimonas viscosa]|uniref:hypothetical protein n=1 Tax=Luteimonas viscosa TaxID=1132694 RepID=UPI001654B3E7|nr:hypothetical protein [Luteimonas viscosa]